MDTVTSSDNKTVKHIAKLAQKKYRDEFGEFTVEGVRNVLDSVAFGRDRVKTTVMSETAYRKYADKFAGLEIVVVADAVMRKIEQTENGQGVICVMAKAVCDLPVSDRCVLLDRVRDPGNVGAIMRTALAFGYDVIANNCADVYSPKAVRSAMSAAVKCNICLDVDPVRLKNAGYKLIVADMGGMSVLEYAPEGKYCLVIGNEAEGVSARISELADVTLAIPQENIESLNAAVAAGVLMFGLRHAKNN